MKDSVRGEILFNIMKGAKTFSELEKSVKLSSSTLSKYLTLMVAENILKVYNLPGNRVKRVYEINKENINKIREYIISFVEARINDASDTIRILLEIKEMDSELWEALVKKAGDKILKLVGDQIKRSAPSGGYKNASSKR